jgi:dihydroorotate dehydrogenase electron transfer subunit
MIQTDAPVTAVERIGPFTRVTFATPGIATGLSAGRFVLAALDGYLRSPLFPARVDADGFDILVPSDHPAAALQPGSSVNLTGPLGQGFEVPTLMNRLLLVADTAHLPALLPLRRPRNRGFRVSEAINPGFSTALLLSASNAAELYPIRLLPPTWEIHLATADGSAGHHGSALDLFPDLVRWADCVCIAADPGTYPALAEVVHRVRLGPSRHFARALVAPPRYTMACGVGACQGCAVPVAHGVKLACISGPVFDLLELR